ncbi:aerobic C4-dicarboxylate transport protein [Plasticicumulans lactativorans]|uniref:Aerobic C4-dicarboxylate transport protein n=1 Tax=Plasticicumulans lactativorans TaxID=1133106 RepID=A0A4R2KTD6_9GAMM|nr:C4-dicarboxylate transporter DctA [Plasticicumulans lactativorans]TCO76027.1 aerobic C4-dicarboxylate transport protein [Plasticicumulans lactativorans]
MIRHLKASLFTQVLIGLVLGIAVGLAYPETAQAFRPLGDGFVKLIRMLIAPIVFCVVVSGITGAGDLRKIGRVGLKAVVYFEAVTTLALLLGLALACVSGIGSGMNVDPHSLDAAALSRYTSGAHTLQDRGATTFLLSLIPTSMVDAFAKGDVLQVLVFSLLFGCALSLSGEAATSINRVIHEAGHVLFRAMGIIVRLAPLGVFGAIAYTTGRYGLGSLQQLGSLVAMFYLGCALFVIGVLGAILRACGFSIFKLLRYLREELTVVLGTASSDSVLPQVMRKLEHLGVRDTTVGLVIPTGYSFNLDGFSIYLTLAAVFIAQATHTPLAFTDLLSILAVSLITSKGAHGIPGSALVILAATLSSVPAIPVIGLVLVLSVDWFMGIARALTNLIGNCVATVVVARWEGDIDRQRAQRVLDGEAGFTFAGPGARSPHPQKSGR